MDANRKAQLGLIFAMASVGSAFLWWFATGQLFLSWYWSYQISALTFAILSVSLPVALAIVGIAAYMAERKVFWNSNMRQKRLLVFLGLAFMLLGGFFGAWYWAMAVYRAALLQPMGGSPLVYYLSTNSPYFVLFGLWFISGLLTFADAVDRLFKT